MNPRTQTPNKAENTAAMTSNERRGDVVVVGAGLVGAMTGIMLGRANYRVHLFELRKDYRMPQTTVGVDGTNSALHGQLTNATKRSINLALSHRGLCALRAVGLEEEVLKNSVLLNELDKMSNVSTTFNARFDKIDKDKGAAIYKPFTANFKSTISPETYSQDCKFVVGADGAFSRVRAELGRLIRLNFSRQYIEHGYKELCIPALPGGKYAMFPNALHIWPRHEFMMIGLPNLDGSFTCTLFMPFKDIERLKTNEAVTKFFVQHFPDVAANNFQLMPSLLHDFFANPTSSLLSITTSPWNYQGKMILLGDASHATVPFYGQGMNAGFEDSLRLFELLEQHNFDTELAFDQVSLDNYVEMRSKTASPLFTLKRKVDSWLSYVIPGWIPLYTMVTFSRIPYHEAIQRAKRQDQILLNALYLSGAALLAGACVGASRFSVSKRF